MTDQKLVHGVKLQDKNTVFTKIRLHYNEMFSLLLLLFLNTQHSKALCLRDFIFVKRRGNVTQYKWFSSS